MPRNAISPEEFLQSFHLVGLAIAEFLKEKTSEENESSSLTAAEAAQLIRCSRSHVYTLYRAGRLSGYCIGERGIRIHKSSAEQFCEQRKKLYGKSTSFSLDKIQQNGLD